jgi:Recombination endonuclease VII
MKKTPEERREYMRQYMARRRQDPVIAQKNRDASRKWRAANPEKAKEAPRAWREKNAERFKELQVAWRVKQGPEKLAERHSADYRSYKRERHLISTFGITAAQYDAMLLEQHNGCALCSRPDLPTKRLAVDHDHVTGKIRALLCDRCNRGIGLMDEDTARLRAAADYIERHRS